MASSPVVLNPPRSRKHASLIPMKWVPVIGALAFICFTSTTWMGGWHTQIWLNDTWHTFLGNWHAQMTGEVNFYARKIGHFFGYGTVGLLFRRAWSSSLRRYALIAGKKLAWMAAAFGVASTFVVASLDEWHQTFLPRRVGCFTDVLIDTLGATFLTAMLYAYRSMRRRRYIAV